ADRPPCPGSPPPFPLPPVPVGAWEGYIILSARHREAVLLTTDRVVPKANPRRTSLSSATQQAWRGEPVQRLLLSSQTAPTVIPPCRPTPPRLRLLPLALVLPVSARKRAGNETTKYFLGELAIPTRAC